MHRLISCVMRVGIDFGTTHTVVASVDRGNYPVVSFDGADTWPSLIAANTAGEVRFGVDAAAVRHEPGWAVLRSFKRLLNDAGPQTEVELAGRSYRLAELLTGFLAALNSELRRRSNAGLQPGETIEAAIGVPANASSAQRLLTLDAFVAGGISRCRDAERALRSRPRIRPSIPLHHYRQTRVRPRLRPRRGHVRRFAAENDRAGERGRHQRGHPAPGRRRFRRGDCAARACQVEAVRGRHDARSPQR